jgi:hypothetical protein
MAIAPNPKRLSSEQCKEKAEECRGQARLSSNPAHRTMLEHMASTWERIALDVSSEKREH